MMDGAETIGNLKDMILKNESVSAKHISIWFNDEELDDPRLLADCDIYEDSILNFRTAMKVYFKTLTGKTKLLLVSSSESIVLKIHPTEKQIVLQLVVSLSDLKEHIGFDLFLYSSPANIFWMNISLRA
jgi:hypothetical protein